MNIKMATKVIILIGFLTTGIKSTKLNASTVIEANTLSKDNTEIVTSLQIRQIQTTSEETPAVSVGNNLNDISNNAPSKALERHEENFLAISPVSLLQKNSVEKKIDFSDKGNVKLYESLKENVTEKNYIVNTINTSKIINDNNLPPPLNFLGENCLQSVYKKPAKINLKPQNEKEITKNLQIKNNKIFGNIWDKRDADAMHSVAIKAWLEKYNNLKNAKKEGKLKKSNDNLLHETTTPFSAENITNFSMFTTVTKEKKEVRKESESFANFTDIDIAGTENSLRASNSLEWFEEMDRSKIKFNSLPQMQNYLIPKFKLEEGFHPFLFMSEFFSLIYPFEFPVGLVKDIIWGQFTFPYSFIQSIKVESTFLAFIVLFICIASIIPSYLIILGIISLFSRSSDGDESETGALFPEQNGSKWSDKLFVIFTFFVIILSCALIFGMVLSSEQSHVAAASSRNVVNCAFSDIATWLSVAARELHYSLVPPIDLVFYAYQEDLKNVDTFLGEPIQQSIASESGIDLVLDSLADIIAESQDLSTKVTSLRNISLNAAALAVVASDRINDLARQIDSLKKQCSPKDAPLCDTLNTHSLELQMKFNSILKEQQLLELRSLGIDNLTLAISTAKQDLRSVPSVIITQTKHVRDNILRDIENRREKVHSSAKVLSDIVRYLTTGLHSFARQLEAGLERFEKYEFWRWTLMLACTVAFTFVMALMLTAMLCGCGKAKTHAKRTLQVSTVWLCFASLLLWAAISAVFLIAGHAEIYICHALWDTSQYNTLSKLFDRPSPLLPNHEGIFDTLFRDLENVTIDVSVRDVLRDCERDQPAYIVFQLDRILDVNKETSYFEWEELQADLGRLSSSVDVSFLRSISAPFNSILNEILVISNVNLPFYRMEYNTPLVGKDLPSLEDQLENIAAQVTDLTTSGRLETLAKRTQRVYISNVKPLEQLRADLVFKLTELELQLVPYRRKLNISLSHIHTAQYYIDNQGDVIAQKKVSMYVSRLISHAAGWRSHVLVSTGKQAARCKPLFAVYAAVRALLCSKYVASLHGWWVCGVVLGLLWCIFLTPLCVKLWRIYDRKINAQDFMTMTNFNTATPGTPATEPCENRNWNTPGPPPLPQENNW